mmetsp:Transcript_11549/g.20888  ORF Transcript_11549/g.20888 Transcript_11549/m.20888 type:complete len:194 (-) Transcript_11549:140-721(-)
MRRLSIASVLVLSVLLFVQSTFGQETVSATLNELELPRGGQVSIGWGLIFTSQGYTQALDDAVISCYSPGFPEFGGPKFYNFTLPTLSSVLTRYFVIVDGSFETETLQDVSDYTNNMLAACSGDSSFSLVEFPVVLADGGEGLFASAATWILGIVAGVLVACLILGAIFYLLRGRLQTYEPSEYADEKEYESD